MYALFGLIGRRGFKLERDGQSVFQTGHKFGIFPSSRANVEDSDFRIKFDNLVGDRLRIIKDGHNIGFLDYSHYRYAKISLLRSDGESDVFRLDQDGYSLCYFLWKDEDVIAKFVTSLNLFRIDYKFDIEILSDTYSPHVLHELFFYAGFQKTSKAF